MPQIPSRPIDSRLHGILDYATGVNLMAVAPMMFGLNGTRTGRMMRMFGAAHAGYSLFTNYELGVIKVLPYKAHLAIDGVWAGAMAAAPWLMGTKEDGAKGVVAPMALAMFEAGSLLMSEPTGKTAADSLFGPGGTTHRGEGMSQTVGDEDRQRTGEPVMPEGAEANAAMGARTIGDAGSRHGGVGSGAGPGSNPPVGGQQL